jgi:hypothetical protein
MLYLDQPVQTGFSYDALVNGTVDYSTGNVAPAAAGGKEGVTARNGTVFAGTFASQDNRTTVNNTVAGAKALWEGLEVWLDE